MSSEIGAMLKLAAFFLTGMKGNILLFLGLLSPPLSVEVVGPKLEEAFCDTTVPLILPFLKWFSLILASSIYMLDFSSS